MSSLLGVMCRITTHVEDVHLSVVVSNRRQVNAVAVRGSLSEFRLEEVNLDCRGIASAGREELLRF